jgi:hypothetical protein
VINKAIAILQARFKDAITVTILYRYSTKAPNGTTEFVWGLAKRFSDIFHRVEHFYHRAESGCEDGE